MLRTEHREENWEFPFVKYSPETQKENLPLIIQLHGAGERGCGGDDLERVDTHGFSKLLKNSEYDCIFVMPQCPADTFWAARVESIVRFVAQLAEKYKVDKDRIYLTGLSMGGTASWLWALGNPERFAAVAPICGEGISWYGGNLVKLPIKVFHGDCDEAVSPHASLAMVSKINKMGGKASLTILPGVKHNAWDYAYNDELIEWFAGHSLKTEDKGNA